VVLLFWRLTAAKVVRLGAAMVNSPRMRGLVPDDLDVVSLLFPPSVPPAVVVVREPSSDSFSDDDTARNRIESRCR
jgi:hypothetical protein